MCKYLLKKGTSLTNYCTKKSSSKTGRIDMASVPMTLTYKSVFTIVVLIPV